jgi:hypothetical protein
MSSADFQVGESCESQSMCLLTADNPDLKILLFRLDWVSQGTVP